MQNLSLTISNRAPTGHTKSRLFSLPPELRDVIYELVLGGKTIHIHLVGGLDHKDENDAEFRSRVCIATDSDKDLISALAKLEDDDETEFESYDDRHVVCQIAGPQATNYPISLLYTCRQIYTETKHLPLASNTFAFDEKEDIDSFRDNMSSESLNEINSIVLSGSTLAYEVFKSHSQFENLQKVQIFKTVFSHWDDDVDTGVWQITDKSICEDDDYEHYNMEPLFPFNPAKFQSVSVCLHYGPGSSKSIWQGFGLAMKTPHLLRKFCREVEALLTE